MTTFGTGEAAELLGLTPDRIRGFVRAGFIEPARGGRGEYRFSFQDLVLLRTAAELARARVPARRITAALARLRDALPEGRPLSGVRIVAAGVDVVVHEGDEPPWDPRSGQFHIDFDIGALQDRVTPREFGPRQVPAGRTAEDWYESGVDLEPISPDDAVAAYERAVELDPGFADARINLGRLLHERGATERAEAQYRAVLDRAEHGLAAFNLGVLLEDLERTDEAIAAYERALAADSELAEAHYNVARLYEERGDQTSAIRHFNGYRRLMRRNGA